MSREAMQQAQDGLQRMGGGGAAMIHPQEKGLPG